MTEPSNDRRLAGDVALALINQHMSDCGARYTELRRDIGTRFESVERTRDIRHDENVRRLDAQDETLSRINRLLFGVAGTLLVGLLGLIGTLIHNGGHL